MSGPAKKKRSPRTPPAPAASAGRTARRKTGTGTGAPPAAATPETAAARLLALLPLPPTTGDGGPASVLWRKEDFGRALPRAEKGHLDAALARLLEDRQLVALEQEGNVFYAFAEPLRARLGGGAPASVPATDDRLREAYRRLVRESGGFPDVKISLLARALGPAAATGLGDRLIALWHTGDAMLSLGDWSLASAETRAAAVEMDGEKYLLVRIEE